MTSEFACAIIALTLSAGSALAQEAGIREVKELQVALKLKDPAVRASAARILGELGTASRVAVPDLVAALKDDSRDVRQSAATSIGLIGHASPEALPALVGLLKDDEWQVRRAAVVSLGRLGDRSADEPLKAARKDTNKSVSEAAKRSLKQLKNQK